MAEIWAKLRREARPGAKAAADAMAEHVRRRTADITLRRTFHPPGAYNRAKGGEPPAYGSGVLAKSMYVKPAHSGIRTSAMVGSKAPYSRIAEFGCVVSATTKFTMAWDDSAGKWYHTVLEHPEHPFLRPTVEEAMDDGSLREAAIEAFRPFDP